MEYSLNFRKEKIMKKIKKFLASVSALTMIAACSSVSASALTAPASYDVNGDGTVNISDVVAVSMALMGDWKPSNLSDIDANQNGIVDDLDRMSIMGYVTMVGIPTITMQ